MLPVITRQSLQDLSKEKLIEIILFLHEKIQQLEKDSTTSSRPPSSDRLDTPKKNQSLREKSHRSSGGQIGHSGRTRIQSATPDSIVACHPEHCSGCGHSLAQIEGAIIGKRQEFDIPPVKLIVTEYRQHRAVCPCCHTATLGRYPDRIIAPVQFGINVKSFVTYLNIRHKVPFQRLAEIFSDILRTTISQGSIENILDQCRSQCVPLKPSILSMIKTGSWVGSDETGEHVNKEKWWLWVWQNFRGSLYVFSESRGQKVANEHFGSDYEGNLVHDCWSAQNNTTASGHQLCHPHLIRDLNFRIEAYNSVWCYRMKRFLLTSERAREAIWTEGFRTETRNRVITEYATRFANLLAIPLSSTKEVATLQKRFRKHREKILHFMKFPEMPFHNNSSEQAIRTAKIHQKISGGFRSEAGAIRHADILSVIETCRKQGLDVLDSLRKICLGEFSFEGVPE
jgi:transposase